MNINEIGQMDFNLPHDLVPLPSGGIYYKSKKKAIKVGYLTASDENLLVSNSRNNNLVLSLLRNKIYETDLRPEELLDGDVEAILIFLRNTSFGSEYTVTLIDPSTEKQFQQTVLLDELNIRQPKVKPDENGLLSTILPKSNVEVKIKLLTYSDTIEIDKMVEQYPVGRVAPRVTWRLNKLIHSINGDTDKGNIALFVESLPIMDSKHIRNFVRENQPSLDLTRTVTAPSGELVTFDVTFGVEFFRPFF